VIRVPKGNQTLKNAHSGYGGPTLIQRIEKQMDKRRKRLEDLRIKHGMANTAVDREQGRFEGLGAAIAILRSSSLEHEIERSNERLGIE